LDSAWIAVAGTLGGVAVTAVAGLFTAMLVGRQQRAALERQFQQETEKQIREERRAIFVDYLKAYDVAEARAFAVINSPAPTVLTQPDVPRPFETVAEMEVGNVNKAFLTLTITASGETCQAASECTGTLRIIGNAAMSGDVERFNREIETAREHMRHLRAAMRKELGVE
jgi:hypothetical protein